MLYFYILLILLFINPLLCGIYSTGSEELAALILAAANVNDEIQTYPNSNVPIKINVNNNFNSLTNIEKEFKNTLNENSENIKLQLSHISNHNSRKNIFNHVKSVNYDGAILTDIYEILPSMRDPNIKLYLGYGETSNEKYFKEILYQCALRLLNKHFEFENINNIKELSASQIREIGDKILKRYDLYYQLSKGNGEQTNDNVINNSISLFDGKIEDIYFPGDGDCDKIFNCIRAKECSIYQKGSEYYIKYTNDKDEEEITEIKKLYINKNSYLLLNNFIDTCKDKDNCEKMFKMFNNSDVIFNFVKIYDEENTTKYYPYISSSLIEENNYNDKILLPFILEKNSNNVFTTIDIENNWMSLSSTSVKSIKGINYGYNKNYNNPNNIGDKGIFIIPGSGISIQGETNINIGNKKIKVLGTALPHIYVYLNKNGSINFDRIKKRYTK